jgi:hypothetical protein
MYIYSTGSEYGFKVRVQIENTDLEQSAALSPKIAVRLTDRLRNLQGRNLAEASTCCDLSIDTEGDFWRAVSSGSIEKSQGTWQQSS